jgi:signal transduction histidine kinase
MAGQLTEPLLVVDATGRLKEANAAARSRLRSAPALGSSIDAALGDEALAAVRRVAESGDAEVLHDETKGCWAVTRSRDGVWLLGLGKVASDFGADLVERIVGGGGLNDVLVALAERSAQLCPGSAFVVELLENNLPVLLAAWPGPAPLNPGLASTTSTGGFRRLPKLKRSLREFAEKVGCPNAGVYEFSVPDTALRGGLALLTPAPVSAGEADIIVSLGKLASCALAWWDTARRLREVSERVHLLSEATQNNVYDWDIESDVMLWSGPAKVFGHHTDREFGHSTWWASQLHPDDAARVVKSLEVAMSNGDLFWMNEYRFRHTNQSYVWVHDRGAFVYDAGKHPVRMVGVMEDISRDREIQSRLVTASRLAAVGTLASSLVHEINNPLTWVTTNVGFALEELSKATRFDPEVSERFEETVEALDDARAGAERISQIIGDLRTFARTSNEDVRPVSVCKVVEEALSMASSQLRHRGRVRCDLNQVPPVLADESRLSQAVSNLLLNAALALAGGHGPDSCVTVRTRSSNGHALIEISDNGPGIPPEILPRIFDPFFTTRTGGEGLGLGLAVTQSIVVGFGGTIEVQSQLGEGTTFVISLPLQAPDRDENSRNQRSEAISNRRRIAVIDDEASTLETFASILGPHHDVHYYERGGQALDVLLLERPDIIFCNRMAPGLSGAELYERLGEAAPELQNRFVALMDSGANGEPSPSSKLMHVPVLEKPFTPEQLEELIARRLRRS